MHGAMSMKIKNKLKYSGLAALVLTIAVGCASTPKEETAEPTVVAEPVVAPAETPKAVEPAPVKDVVTSYEVVRGDNLWNISGKGEIYGNPYQWPLIYKANRDKIKDADLIYPGQAFDIDRSASGSDIEAAIHHAKTRGAWSLGVVEESDKAYLAR